MNGALHAWTILLLGGLTKIQGQTAYEWTGSNYISIFKSTSVSDPKVVAEFCATYSVDDSSSTNSCGCTRSGYELTSATSSRSRLYTCETRVVNQNTLDEEYYKTTIDACSASAVTLTIQKFNDADCAPSSASSSSSGGSLAVQRYTIAMNDWIRYHEGTTCIPATDPDTDEAVALHLSGPATWWWLCSQYTNAPSLSPTSAPSFSPTLNPTVTASDSDSDDDNTALIAIIVGVSFGLLMCLMMMLLVWWFRYRSAAISPEKQLAFEMALQKSSGDESWAHERLMSEHLGVSVRFITNGLLSAATAGAHEAAKSPETYKLRSPESMDPTNPSFREVASVLCYSEKAKGCGMVCPRDRQVDCSYVDALNSEGNAGQATQFLSWVWSYKVQMFITTIETWISQSARDDDNTFLWVCFFCEGLHVDRLILTKCQMLGNNQFRLLSNADDLEVVFEERLSSCGAMLAMLDGWEDPTYLTRIWTIFEQYSAKKMGINISIILPPEIMCSFAQEIEAGNIKRIKASLLTIDVENAKASRLEDEVKVKALINQTVGFAVVNQAVQQCMQKWCAGVFKAYLEGVINELEESASALNEVQVDAGSGGNMDHWRLLAVDTQHATPSSVLTTPPNRLPPLGGLTMGNAN